MKPTKRLQFFEFMCGTFKVGTWAYSRREAKKIVISCRYIPQDNHKYGKSLNVMQGIVI